MPNKTTLSIAALICLACVCLAADDVVIPPGVNYTKTSDKINEQAKQKLQQVFSAKATDKDVLALFQEKILICGPGLWRAVKDDPAMSKLTLGDVELQVPVFDADGKVLRTDKLQGKIFQTDADMLVLWKTFTAKMDFTDLKIRKLTSAELEIYWSMISFDITEPVFMVEGKDNKILMQFTSPEKLTVTWIDDYQNVTMRKPKEKAKDK